MWNPQSSKKLYLDANAGSLLPATVKQAIKQYLDKDAEKASNPSSRHSFGKNSQNTVLQLLEEIAQTLGVFQHGRILGHIELTASGTDSVRKSIDGLLRQTLKSKSLSELSPKSVLITDAEHDCVFEALSEIEVRSGRSPGELWDSVSLSPSGAIDLQAILNACTDSTRLVCINWVNNESGAVFDSLSELSQELKKRGILLHLDGVQALGRIDVASSIRYADAVSFSGHKIGAPSGIGFVWSSLDLSFPRLGTENMLGIVGLLAALKLREYWPEWNKQNLDDFLRFEHQLQKLGGIEIIGQNVVRAPGITQFVAPNSSRKDWIQRLDIEGYLVSSGAACQSHSNLPSRSLLSMGIPEKVAKTSVRVSCFEPSDAAKLLELAEVVGRLI